jgi:ATP:ADP antiporter, AAA family
MSNPSNSPENKPMSVWRERLWPIYSEELPKFLPMVIMMFCILFNYTVVRNVKDSLLINTPHGSSHVLPWVKVCIVSPLTIAFVILYAKLSNVLSRERLYYICLVPFVIFFLLFGFVIYPNHDHLHASYETIADWKERFPYVADFMVAMGYWTFSLYYLMAELWGNVGVALLFWQFAIYITPTEQAKRFFPLFGFWSNLALVCAGFLTKYSEALLAPERLPSGEKDFSKQVLLFSICVAVGGLITGLTYRWMNKNVLTNPKLFDAAKLVKKGKEKKPKMSIGESIKFLAGSKYLGYITILVLAYGVTINIAEIIWKDQVSLYLIDPLTGRKDQSAYNSFMGEVFIYTGVVTMILIMFSKNLLRSLGWLFSASFTPWVMLISGVIFFMFLSFSDQVAPIAAYLGTTSLHVTVVVGLIQTTLSKGTKYSLFDPTKEMAYIPLDEESKTKGKAAIDVIGGRLGKSGGSLIQMASKAVLKVFSAGDWLVPLLGGVFIGFSMIWIAAVKKLSVLYHQKLEEKEEE